MNLNAELKTMEEKMLDIEEVTRTLMTDMKEMIESGQGLMPALFVIKQPPEIELYEIAKIEDKKDAVAELIREKTLDQGTLFTVFLAEAWIAPTNNVEEFQTLCDVPISIQYMPGRKEGISASICGRGMKPFLATWMFTRDKNNKPVFEAEPVFQCDAKTEIMGRFIPTKTSLPKPC